MKKKMNIQIPKRRSEASKNIAFNLYLIWKGFENSDKSIESIGSPKPNNFHSQKSAEWSFCFSVWNGPDVIFTDYLKYEKTIIIRLY